jgi:hypothetical protein
VWTLGWIGAEWTALFDIRDDKVTRIDHYYDRERAFADAGLAPEDVASPAHPTRSTEQ